MMIDTPKAIHFVAFTKSGPLNWNDPVGLQYRWAAAESVRREVVINMINLSEENRNKIRELLTTVNTGRKIKVALACDPNPFVIEEKTRSGKKKKVVSDAQHT